MEEYYQLEQIVNETVEQSARTKNLDLIKFFHDMEAAFKRLGFRDRPMTNPGSINNILLIRWDNVGDFIFTTPAIREIRANFPNAFITLVVRKATYNIAELCPHVNEVLSFDEVGNVDDWVENIYFSTAFSKKYLWRRRYDIAFSFRCWEDSRSVFAMWLMYVSGARERVAYRHDSYRVHYGELLPPEKNISCILLTSPIIKPLDIVHHVSKNLYLIQVCGLRVKQTDMEVWYNKTDLYEAKKLLKNFGEGRVKVFVTLGASNPNRIYPVEKYLIAFREIIRKGASIVILDGPEETEDAEFLEENLPTKYVKNLVKCNLTWRTTAAIISMLDMYIGNDTGTHHIASVLKKPVIVLSRVAKDRKINFPKVPTDMDGSQPWHNHSIIIQPEHQLGDCKTILNPMGCSMGYSHCIAQIDPRDIVTAYEKMAMFIRDIKQVNCPVIIKSIDQSMPLIK